PRGQHELPRLLVVGVGPVRAPFLPLLEHDRSPRMPLTRPGEHLEHVGERARALPAAGERHLDLAVLAHLEHHADGSGVVHHHGPRDEPGLGAPLPSARRWSLARLDGLGLHDHGSRGTTSRSALAPHHGGRALAVGLRRLAGPRSSPALAIHGGPYASAPSFSSSASASPSSTRAASLAGPPNRTSASVMPRSASAEPRCPTRLGASPSSSICAALSTERTRTTRPEAVVIEASDVPRRSVVRTSCALLRLARVVRRRLSRVAVACW